MRLNVQSKRVAKLALSSGRSRQASRAFAASAPLAHNSTSLTTQCSTPAKVERRMRPVLGRVLLAVLGASTVLASQGDRSPAFQRCVATCGRACPAEPPRTWQPVLWSAWSCAADCAYTCTTSLTNLALISPPPATPLSPDELEPAEQNAMRLVGPGGDLEGLELGRMVQFSGKWPFRRYLGTQEILSVIFSLANLWAHAKGWRELGRLDGVASADPARRAGGFAVLRALIAVRRVESSSARLLLCDIMCESSASDS
mgnify:CR=1 FL=1